ncbi:MAG: glucosidase [Williamsia sp.]|nr:glucosidase [Williamsia sp.]
MGAEQERMDEQAGAGANWLKWGPYLSERQWGTVREDYSADGKAWEYLTHEMARSKAYRWGEDGIGGWSDEQQQLCMALALWNEKDPILKERLFGLTNGEGNHGEDVKELYYYLDNTPTHSYQKMLYKYPCNAYPYAQLVEENKKRSRQEGEFELMDTGIFQDDAYFDVFIEYAKATPEDILIRYTVYNRSGEAADLHLLPQLWFRNTWRCEPDTPQPLIKQAGKNTLFLQANGLGNYSCYAAQDAPILFTNNETNNQRLYGSANDELYVKDGINDRVVQGNQQAVDPGGSGTKAAFWYKLHLLPGEKKILQLRISDNTLDNPFEHFETIFSKRLQEADLFYETKQTGMEDEDLRMIQRQAWAGLLWNKQYYGYDVNRWLQGDPGQPAPSPERMRGRNNHWRHFVSQGIIAMPDKWEYPWFAAWDLAFQCIALAGIDPRFAKNQLLLLLQVNYQHPNGQLPAYEWDFSDVNPPVHALAAWHVYKLDKAAHGKADGSFLQEVFQKLLLNFTWWVNRKDSEGNNIFEGGFLGLDNIGIFNRSAPVPGGGHLEQADGSSWMAMYALNMMQIAMELSLHNPVYESMAIKFSEHFLFIAGSITHMGEDFVGLWDEKDGFYYDLLRKPGGDWDRLRLRSLVGLIPLYAAIVFDEAKWTNLPLLTQRMDQLKMLRPDLAALVSNWKDKKGNEQHLLSLLRGHRMKLLLKRMLDPAEFLSDHGIRSLSKIYQDQPYVYWLNGMDLTVRYEPGESGSTMFGGNSNWRGPIWMPLNFLLIEALYTFHEYYTDEFRVEYPTGSGQYLSLAEIAQALCQRVRSLFTRNEQGERPLFGGEDKFNKDQHFKDYILFYEYFHGDSGKGLGASHQTGWTALITALIKP